MSKRGFPGGMGGFGGMNINQLMKEAKKMQADMEKSQTELASKDFDASVGGGAVYEKVVKGDNISYNISVVNNANISVVYHVVDTLPAGFVYTGSSDGGSYDASSNTVTWDILVDANSNKVLTIYGYVNVSGVTLVNNVSVSNVTNNVNVTNTTNFTVDNLANITITKVANVSTASYNDFVEFNVTVTNNGQNASEVKVEEKLPAGLINITFNVTKGEYDEAKRIWYIGDLVNAETVVLTVRGKVNISNGALLNVVVVTSNTSDYDEVGNIVNITNKTTNTSVDVGNINVVIVAVFSDG